MLIGMPNGMARIMAVDCQSKLQYKPSQRAHLQPTHTLPPNPAQKPPRDHGWQRGSSSWTAAWATSFARKHRTGRGASSRPPPAIAAHSLTDSCSLCTARVPYYGAPRIALTDDAPSLCTTGIRLRCGTTRKRSSRRTPSTSRRARR